LTTFGIIDVACMSLAIALVDLRESAIIKRRQATPQPAWVIVSGRAATTVLSASVTAGLLLVIGRLAYGASTPIGALLPLFVAVAVGSVVFCCLGFAITGMIRSLQSAQPVVMGLIMPLFFISGVFVPWPFIPPWLQHVAAVFPVRPLALAILAPITGHSGQSSWSWGNLAIVAAWGLGGLVIALRTFKWAPQDV
jgi:ABC-2 type transport system permease protein